MRKISILLIEDNSDDEWLALKSLEKIGIVKVTTARDGLSALSMLHGNNKTGERATCKPDLILLDLRLPIIDGLDVLREIRADESTRKTKVFVVSASDFPKDRDVCQELGVSAFISKPLDSKKILNLIMS